LGFGVIFYLTAGYLIFVFKYLIIENIFGSTFIKEAEKGAINTTPLHPNFAQLIIIIILQIIIVGPCEEGFFRGFILKRCGNKVKSFYAILISSFFFAIYHTPPLLVSLTTIITYFSYYFVFGLLLALIFKLFKNSLIPCSIAHSFFNILIIIF
ncbi:MAG TPA: CPBP family intramembrane glutamic endopeptidase, partial [Candidatus Lokiarchaeia archaeon]